MGFGRLADAFGRKRLFLVTVGLYLAATVATGLSWNFTSFLVFRFLTGAGIGGEYSAINSAIQELIPARRRGFTDLVINGSYWVGAALGALGTVVLLNPHVLPVDARLARRLLHRRGGRPDRHGGSPLPAGEPALADDPRPGRRGAMASSTQIEAQVRRRRRRRRGAWDGAGHPPAPRPARRLDRRGARR